MGACDCVENKDKKSLLSLLKNVSEKKIKHELVKKKVGMGSSADTAYYRKVN